MTFEKAIEIEEYIHIYITNKTESLSDLKSLFDYQETYIRARSESCEIEYFEKKTRSDADSFLRVAKYSKFDITDYTWFVNFCNSYFYCTLLTLLTPLASAKKNLRRLEKIMKEAIPMDVVLHDLQQTDGSQRI